MKWTKGLPVVLAGLLALLALSFGAAAAHDLVVIGHGGNYHAVVDTSTLSGSQPDLPPGTVVLGQSNVAGVHIQYQPRYDMSNYDPFAEDRGIPSSTNQIDDDEGLGADEAMHSPTWYMNHASENGVMPGGVQAQNGAVI